jgi:hypothetical protein
MNTQPLQGNSSVSKQSNTYQFNSAERRHNFNIKCSSSRYRYESREDEDDDQEYQCELINEDIGTSTNAHKEQLISIVP